MSKRTIPRVALATLVLGGACGGGGSGNPRSTPIEPLTPITGAGSAAGQTGGGGAGSGGGGGQARLEDVVQAACKQLSLCEPEDFQQDYENVSECAKDLTEEFSKFIESESKACTSAMLNFYACFSKLSCEAMDDGESACGNQYEQMTELCDFDDGDTDSSSGGGSSGGNGSSTGSRDPSPAAPDSDDDYDGYDPGV